MRKVFKLTVFLIVTCFSNCVSNKNKGSLSTYYTEMTKHEIVYYHHYIYMDTTISIKDSSQWITKITNYIDTVKDDQPVGAVSIVCKEFPLSPDEINWPVVSNNTIFDVRYLEDSLKKGKNVIEKVEIKSLF